MKYSTDIKASMAKEWTSWNDHPSFIPILRNKAENVIDACWLLKWKIIDGKKMFKSRLCVRGFEDQQGDHLTTSASTAARWTQRMVCSVAANHGWKISIADVHAAFLKGMSFEEMNIIRNEKLRVVHLNLPKGSWKFLSAFAHMKGCGESTHVLGLIKGVYTSN